MNTPADDANGKDANFTDSHESGFPFAAIRVIRVCSFRAAVFALAIAGASAATVLSGNVSGTWTTNGSPYILSADCIVPTNQTLMIEPGVTVLMGSNVTLGVNGGISAIGTQKQPVAIQSADPGTRWSSIAITNSGFTNTFHFCEIRDNQHDGILAAVLGGNTVSTLDLRNCDFAGEGGVFAWTRGATQGSPWGPPFGNAVLNLEVRNCQFHSGGVGLIVFMYSRPMGEASVNATISGNIFKDLGWGIYAYGDGMNISRPLVINNTFFHCEEAVISTGTGGTAAECVIRNNLFLSNSNAISRDTNAPTTPDASYNCLSSNGVNFIGYSNAYGMLTRVNHNSTPCDAFFNILVDPRLRDSSQFLLASNSPCIDAGDPAISDGCFWFSYGSPISDIGAYGGPDSCGWPGPPAITKALQDQSSCVGGSVTFKVTVEGSTPLEYRWYFNGNLLAGETNAQLNLANLQTNQAGLYSVAVSNGFGSVTSALARLLINDACVVINAYAGLSITGMVGRTYVIDWATNLSAVNWTPLVTNTFTTTRWLFIDTNTPVIPQRVFRVRLLP